MKEKNYNAVRCSWLCVLVGLALFAAVLGVARVVFAACFVSPSLFVEHSADIPLLLANALRFDLQVAAYCALPLVVCALVTTCAPALAERVSRIGRIIAVVLAVLLSLLSLSDIVYYYNFGKHFGIVAFDFLDEEPAVLLRGIVDDNPVLLVVLASTLLGFVVFWAFRWAQRRLAAKHLRCSLWLWSLPVVAIVFVMGRGGLGAFTLRVEDLSVSSSRLVNDCVPNAVYMLRKAWRERSKQFKIEDDDEILADAGFASLRDAMAAARGIAADSLPDDLPLDSVLLDTTSSHPPREGYDVVVILAESWADRPIDFDSLYGMDLLGPMRRHMNEDLLWRRFVSSTNSTIDAMEDFVMDTPYRRIFETRHGLSPAPYATARIWARHGYSTHFVTGIALSWRNIAETLPCQGFESVVGLHDVLDAMPDAQVGSSWGVFDHSMLEYLLRQLEAPSADGRPRFFLALTSTNHPPFVFPEGYEMPAFSLPKSDATLAEAFAIADRDVIANYMKGYQYTSHALGNFMTQLKASPAGRRTIVLVTGDHNMRLVLPCREGDDPMVRHSVPMYLYVPDAPDAWRSHTSRCGGHADVVPTLANLTLANARLPIGGQDLLADSLAFSFGINEDYALLSPEADSASVMKRQAAINALKKIWFARTMPGVK